MPFVITPTGWPRSSGWSNRNSAAAGALGVASATPQTPVPFRRLAPFAAVLLLAALANGYPMIRFGFNWISYGDDDMTNYLLAANSFEPRPIRAPFTPRHHLEPGWQPSLVPRLYFIAMRHGADEYWRGSLVLTRLSARGRHAVSSRFNRRLSPPPGRWSLQSRFRRAALLAVLV